MRQQLSHGPADLPALLDHWLAAGVITPEQAARMRADAGLPAQPPNLTVLPVPPTARAERSSLLIEALGYLGGVVILVAAVLLTAQYWSDLSTWAHLAIVGGAAVVLVLAGFAVPLRLGVTAHRLRAVLWLLSTGATASRSSSRWWPRSRARRRRLPPSCTRGSSSCPGSRSGSSV
jgi:hypothetical protein